MNEDLRPTCKTCWFSKVKTTVESLRKPDGERVHINNNYRYCLYEPQVITKDDDDFCHNHPAWPEFEARSDAIGPYYEQYPSQE